MRIGIVGAGMAGLACAAQLRGKGHQVILFDKGRRPGGRMSTRRASVPGQDERMSFDHGAQYFTARDPDFAAFVERLSAEEVVTRWPAVGDDAWTGRNAMSDVITHMAASEDVRFGIAIERVEQSGEGWRLHHSDGVETGDTLIVAVPAEQAPVLLQGAAPTFAAKADTTPSHPCWTVMASFDARLQAPDIIRDAAPIGWAVREPARPNRTGGERWTVQADPDWSKRHLEDAPELVAERLLHAFADHVGDASARRPEYLMAHRWRYARSGSLGEDFLFDPEARLGVCGDWLLGPRVENAWLSGFRLGRAMAKAFA